MLNTEQYGALVSAFADDIAAEDPENHDYITGVRSAAYIAARVLGLPNDVRNIILARYGMR